ELYRPGGWAGARRELRRLGGWAVVLALAAAVACNPVPQPRAQTVTIGDPQQGAQAMVDYGCVSCHHIPGVPGADAYVGPPLDAFGRRSYIAGSLRNDEDNLVRWSTDPQGVEPGTAMPDLGVTHQDAVNIAAYLLSLR
ncbi:MAG: c-type cytochrome, partial [Egibacteraceae bacterium]